MPLTGADAAEQLDRGAIDVAVAHLRALPARSKRRRCCATRLSLIARQGHPLAAATAVASKPMRRCNHVLVSPRGDTSGAIDRILVDFGLRRRIALLVATYLALPAALAASDLVATVPRRTARQIAAIAEIEILPLPIDLVGDRVDGLAPPRRERAGAGLVPSAPDRGGTGRGLTRLSRAAFFGSASGTP